MSINVSLPPELETRVRQRVESGMYGSASEVIREALRHIRHSLKHLGSYGIGCNHLSIPTT